MGFISVLAYAQQLIKERVHPGDIVIDATIGNGNDTLSLLEQVRERGTVYGFDIQEAALAHTTARINAAGRSMDNVHLVLDNHANMARHIPMHEHGRVAAVMFNLGYLPGAEEVIITQTPTTLLALEAALELLRPRGIITTVLYPGHEGGDVEAAAVLDWARGLSSNRAQSLCYRFVNTSPRSPYLIAIEKR